MKRWLQHDDAVPIAALVLGVAFVIFQKADSAKHEAPAGADPRRSDWHALSVGPMCAQINGTRRRYWHPNVGMPCDVRDAPAWPPGDYAFAIDYLLPQEVISNDRRFVLVPESDKPAQGF